MALMFPGMQAKFSAQPMARRPMMQGSLTDDELAQLDPQRRQALLAARGRVSDLEKRVGQYQSNLQQYGSIFGPGQSASPQAPQQLFASRPPTTTYGGAWGSPSPAESALNRLGGMQRPAGGTATVNYQRPEPKPVDIAQQNQLAMNIAQRNGMYAIAMPDGSVRVSPQGGPSTIAGTTLFGNPAMEGRDTGVNMIGNPTLRYRQDGAQLAQLQQAAASRRAETMAGRQAMVADAAIGRAQQRDQRIAERKAGPNPLFAMMADDPQTALAYMQMQQRGAMFGAQLGMDQQRLAQQDRQFGATLDQGNQKFAADSAFKGKELEAKIFSSLTESGMDPLEAGRMVNSWKKGGLFDSTHGSGGSTPRWVTGELPPAADAFVRNAYQKGATDQEILPWLDKLYPNHGYSMADGKLKKGGFFDWLHRSTNFMNEGAAGPMGEASY